MLALPPFYDRCLDNHGVPRVVPTARAVVLSQLGTVSGYLRRPRTHREHTLAAVRPARPTRPKHCTFLPPLPPQDAFFHGATLSNHHQQPPAPLRFVGGLPTDLQWTARGHNTAKSHANLGQTPAHNPNTCLNPVFRLFIHHNSVSQADLGAHFTRAIDSIHQGLSNALLD